MTTEQRVLRLESLLCAIYDALPAFIRNSLPDLVHYTLNQVKEEISK